MSKIIIVLGVLLLLLPGCDEQQLGPVDRIVSDVNDSLPTVTAVLQSPAGALLPPDLRLYAAAAVALASIGVNSWQKVRAVLMTKTTKAIVKGIEAAGENTKTNPKNLIKDSIKTEMQLAGIYDRGNLLVDRLKIAR